MKKQYTVVFMIGALLFCSFNTSAQTANKKNNNKQASKASLVNKIDLEQAIAALTRAMIDADSNQLKAYTHDSLSYGHSGGAVDNQKIFVQKISSGASDFVSIDISEQEIKFIGNTAIVRQSFYAKTNDKGMPGEVKLKILQVWILDLHHWKLLARQAVKLS